MQADLIPTRLAQAFEIFCNLNCTKLHEPQLFPHSFIPPFLPLGTKKTAMAVEYLLHESSVGYAVSTDSDSQGILQHTTSFWWPTMLRMLYQLRSQEIPWKTRD